MRELPEDVVQSVDRLHGSRGVQEWRLRQRARRDIDQQRPAGSSASSRGGTGASDLSQAISRYTRGDRQPFPGDSGPLSCSVGLELVTGRVQYPATEGLRRPCSVLPTSRRTRNDPDQNDRSGFRATSPGMRRHMRCLICRTCEDVVGLEGDAVRCRCGRSIANRDLSGWTYTGPAEVALCMEVHEPELHRMARRLIPMPDDDLTHRSAVEALS